MIVSMHLTHSSAGMERIQDLFMNIRSKAMAHLGDILSRNGHVVLSTCNRFEIYAETDDPRMTKERFGMFAEIIRCTGGCSFLFEGEDTARHLMRVTCGLDSLIVGEDQIQGQVRSAYTKAKEECHASGELALLFDRALAVGKRVRTETALNNGAVSVGSAAVDLAERMLDDIKGITVTVIGAGEMAEAVARNLVCKGIDSIFVSNRTMDNAIRLAEMLNGTAVGLGEKVTAIERSDLVIVATSAPHILLDRGEVEAAMKGREGLTVIDLSVPRNTDPAISSVPGVSIETIGSLRAIAAENMGKRMSEIQRATEMIEEEMERMRSKAMERKAESVIRGICIRMSEIREQELSKAMTRASNPDMGEVFDDFSRALMSRMLAHTYEKIKEASRNGDDTKCDIAAELFGLEGMP